MYLWECLCHKVIKFVGTSQLILPDEVCLVLIIVVVVVIAIEMSTYIDKGCSLLVCLAWSSYRKPELISISPVARTPRPPSISSVDRTASPG